MPDALDEGIGLFAGLNAIPKRSTLTEYSCRIAPDCVPRWTSSWLDAAEALSLDRGSYFDLDFHTIPFHGHRALTEKHYVSKRSRRQNGILAFLARDAGTGVLCFADATVRKENQNQAVLRFIEAVRDRTGSLPAELVFDSRLTTHAVLGKIDGLGIRFITLRRRSAKMIRNLLERPPGDWRRVRLHNVGRSYRTPRVIESQVRLQGCPQPLRQIAVADLGHDKPTPPPPQGQLRRPPHRPLCPPHGD